VNPRAAERGSALIEFVLATGLLLVPLLLGTVVFGLNLTRANQVTGVCRDAAHMYAYGVDFSQNGNKDLLLQLAQGLNMTVSGGNGVVILSTITYIDDGDCKAAGLPPGGKGCENDGKTVFTRRIVIGNRSLFSSAFGTPSSSIVDSSTGQIDMKDFLSAPSAEAVGFKGTIPGLASGQYAYMAEMYVTSPDYSLGNSFGLPSISSRSIF
jgi:hypothetical protein